jgi:glucose/arabinose dehydrogenase|tara:strand:+ start:367 stop:1857 length:1491 start_codon:yes stop_codon:yes gene_type:complete
MKIKSKKLKIIFLITALFFLYISISKLITNRDHNIFFKIKSYIPNSIKHNLKNTIFIIPTLNKTIKDLNEKNKSLQITINDNKIILRDIKNKYFSGSYPFISFYLKEEDKIIESRYAKYKFTKFQTNFLDNGKAVPAKASAYIEELGDKILLVNADGVFSYFYKKNLDQDKFDSITIPTNIKEIIKYPAFYKRSEDGIKDILIDNNKLFVSFSNKLPNDCYNTSILIADINFEYLSFKKFFVPSQCVKKNNEYGWINHHIAGGRMVNFKNNKILFSTGALQYFKHPQDKNSPLGKILSIDKNTANWKIISMGHRNVQGLKYDFKKDIIFSTEHGPTGGDEFNINFNPNSNDVKNYGWPISSYGEHGSYKAIKDPKELKLRYDKAPLNKSHKKYGFIEPIKYYVPSIGITEIEMIPKKFNKNFDNDFFIASMGTNKEEGDLSIHHIKLDKEFKKILKEDIIFIGERIRDFKYLEDINKIVLFIENSPGIGVLSHSTN